VPPTVSVLPFETVTVPAFVKLLDAVVRRALPESVKDPVLLLKV